MEINRRAQLSEYIAGILPRIAKEPNGFLPNPYLSISCGRFYARAIFVWDNHHMAMRLAAAGKPEYFRHHIDAFLHYQVGDGFTPCVIDSELGPMHYSPRFHAQPFLAQGVWFHHVFTGDAGWSERVFPKLEKYLKYYEERQCAPNGLFRWGEPWMSGFDNNIALTMFPGDAVTPPDINSWIYLEYRAMACLAGALGLAEAAAAYRGKAEALAGRINDLLWCEERETYLGHHLLFGRKFMSLGDCSPGDADNSGDIGQVAFQNCANLIPLYARIAPPGRAVRMIRRWVTAKEHFRSDYGIRSLSRSSEYYNNAIWGNPCRFGDFHRLTNSNWQGPVWIPLNYFMTCALDFYGCREEALALGDDTLRVLTESLDAVGSFAENFDGDTGKPLYCREFASWNILADRMLEELDSGDWLMNRLFEK